MCPSSMKSFLIVLPLILIIHAFSSQVAAVLSRTTDINSHSPIQQGVRGLDIATTSVLQERHHAKNISVRQYQYANTIVNGWLIHFTLHPMSMPVYGAGWAITDMWTHVLSEARNWRDLPELGAFAIAYGDNLRVYFEPLGTTATGAHFTIPWWLVVALANWLRNYTLHGGLGPFDIMLTQGNAAVFVRVELLGSEDY